ncbi:hypothetical protein DPMN_149553, partial [Dreissena polymorpha]
SRFSKNSKTKSIGTKLPWMDRPNERFKSLFDKYLIVKDKLQSFVDMYIHFQGMS